MVILDVKIFIYDICNLKRVSVNFSSLNLFLSVRIGDHAYIRFGFPMKYKKLKRGLVLDGIFNFCFAT